MKNKSKAIDRFIYSVSIELTKVQWQAILKRNILENLDIRLIQFPPLFKFYEIITDFEDSKGESILVLA